MTADDAEDGSTSLTAGACPELVEGSFAPSAVIKGSSMASNDGAGSGSILLAFILGAVSGAAVALLYAPATGEETRKFIGQKAKEGRDRAADLTEKGRQAVTQGRDTLTTAIDRGREAYQQARRENA
jgi:gas vesicle protein